MQTVTAAQISVPTIGAQGDRRGFLVEGSSFVCPVINCRFHCQSKKTGRKLPVPVLGFSYCNLTSVSSNQRRACGGESIERQVSVLDSTVVPKMRIFGAVKRSAVIDYHEKQTI